MQPTKENMTTQFLSLLGQVTAPGAKWLAAVCMSAVAFVLPDQFRQDMATAVFVLIILDTVTGLCAAAVTGKAVTSAKFGRVLVKIVAYGSVLIVASIVGKFLAPGSPLLQGAQVGVLTLIICRESLSVLENVNAIGLVRFKFLEDLLKGRVKEINAKKQTEAEG